MYIAFNWYVNFYEAFNWLYEYNLKTCANKKAVKIVS